MTDHFSTNARQIAKTPRIHALPFCCTLSWLTPFAQSRVYSLGQHHAKHNFANSSTRKHADETHCHILAKQLSGMIDAYSFKKKFNAIWQYINQKYFANFVPDSEVDMSQKTLKKLKALVVDDENITRIVHRAFLESLDYDVKTATDGHQALEHLQDDFELILMDYNMPDMTGAVVTQEIRKKNNSEKQPLIIGVTGEEDIETICLAAGMNHVLKKPISKTQLADVIKQLGKNKQ